MKLTYLRNSSRMGRNEKRFCKKPPPPYFLILNGVARRKDHGTTLFIEPLNVCIVVD